MSGLVRFAPSLADEVRVTLPELPLMYRPRGIATLVGLSRPAVSAAIKKGELKARKLNGCVVVTREAVEQWINAVAVPWRPK